jgi:hypothetical protein
MPGSMFERSSPCPPKVAGSFSLAASLPTIVVAFGLYSRDRKRSPSELPGDLRPRFVASIRAWRTSSTGARPWGRS